MTVVINGSPNKDGFTKKIIESTVKEDYIDINAYLETIKACDDCKYCNTLPGCKWDDMDYIYDLLSKCDKLVIASPLYFGALSSKLHNIITRFQTFYSQKYYRKVDMFQIKESVLIVTAGGEYPDMFNGPIATMKILNMLFRVEKYTEVFKSNTDK